MRGILLRIIWLGQHAAICQFEWSAGQIQRVSLSVRGKLEM
jgi:hypothetical protein